MRENIRNELKEVKKKMDDLERARKMAVITEVSSSCYILLIVLPVSLRLSLLSDFPTALLFPLTCSIPPYLLHPSVTSSFASIPLSPLPQVPCANTRFLYQ